MKIKTNLVFMEMRLRKRRKSCDSVEKMNIHVTQLVAQTGLKQNMALFLIFLSVILVPCCLGSGGIEERKTDDPQVLEALDFAMNEFNAMQNNMYRFMATKVEDATFQVSLTFLQPFLVCDVNFDSTKQKVNFSETQTMNCDL